MPGRVEGAERGRRREACSWSRSAPRAEASLRHSATSALATLRARSSLAIASTLSRLSLSYFCSAALRRTCRARQYSDGTGPQRLRGGVHQGIMGTMY